MDRDFCECKFDNDLKIFDILMHEHHKKNPQLNYRPVEWIDTVDRVYDVVGVFLPYILNSVSLL